MAKILPKNDEWIRSSTPSPMPEGTRRRLMNRLCRRFAKAHHTGKGWWRAAVLLRRLRDSSKHRDLWERPTGKNYKETTK